MAYLYDKERERGKERETNREREIEREKNQNIKHFRYSVRRRQVWECLCVKRERETRKCTIMLAQVCTLNFKEKKREKNGQFEIKAIKEKIKKFRCH